MQVNVTIPGGRASAPPGLSEAELRATFSKLDTNGDGFIDTKELNGLLKSLDRCEDEVRF